MKSNLMHFPVFQNSRRRRRLANERRKGGGKRQEIITKSILRDILSEALYLLARKRPCANELLSERVEVELAVVIF